MVGLAKRFFPACGKKRKIAGRIPFVARRTFGSFARGTQVSGQSDVDILVEVGRTIGLGFVTLAERLEHLLGARVDSSPAAPLNLLFGRYRTRADRCRTRAGPAV